jgi:hypothetical protein
MWPPLEMPVAYTRFGSMPWVAEKCSTSDAKKATSSMSSVLAAYDPAARQPFQWRS